MLRYRGLTIPEMLVAILFMGIVASSVVMIFIQSTRVYARTREHAKARTSQATALNRMSRDFREALGVQLHTNKWITLTVPVKGDADIVNQVVEDGTTHLLVTQPSSSRVHYFVGTPNAAAPNAGGTVLYRALGSETATGPFPHAEVVLQGLKPDNNIPVFDYADSRYVYVTLLMPVSERTAEKPATATETSVTKFFVRSTAVTSL